MSDEEIRRLRRSLDGLRKEHRDLKEKVDEDILEYLEEERKLLEQVRDKLADYQELREEIERLEGELGEEIERKVKEVRTDFVSSPENILERVKKLETRVDALSSDE